MKHYTSIEQSKRLVELGLNIGTADMYYVSDDYSTPRIGVPLGLSPNVPCWSLGAFRYGSSTNTVARIMP